MTLEGKATATEKSVATMSERVRSTEGAVFGLSDPMDHSVDAGREAEAPTRHAESDEVAELRAKIAQLEQGSSATRPKTRWPSAAADAANPTARWCLQSSQSSTASAR